MLWEDLHLTNFQYEETFHDGTCAGRNLSFHCEKNRCTELKLFGVLPEEQKKIPASGHLVTITVTNMVWFSEDENLFSLKVLWA